MKSITVLILFDATSMPVIVSKIYRRRENVFFISVDRPVFICQASVNLTVSSENIA